MSLSIINPRIVYKIFKLTLLVSVFAIGLVGSAVAQTQVAANRNSVPARGAEKTKPVVFTEKDRQFALNYLAETKAAFVKTISGLSEKQLNFRTDPKRWSPAEVAEHIIIAESRVVPLIAKKIIKSPIPAGRDNFRIKDQAVMMTVTNRSRKFNAPPIVQPKQTFKTKAELIEAFSKVRGKTVSFAQNTNEDLRGHFADNPLMGMIDSYQWLIFITAHTERHLAQIKEITRHKNFPKK